MAVNLTFTIMSKIRVISNPLQSGRNGANTYYVTKGTQIVRPSRNNSNYGEGASRTPAQQARRIVWSNPVNFFKISAFWMKKAFERKEANQTDYNKFMSLNIGRSICAFTKSEAQSSACVAEGFIVSQGSIPSVAHTKGTDVIISSIVLSADMDVSSPVAQLAADILDKNPGLDDSYQLSLIVYQQSTDSNGVPRLHCYAYELNLNDTRTDVYGTDIFPSSLIANEAGALAIKLTGYTGGACFVLSSSGTRGSVRVSSQELIVNNDYLIGLYSGGDQYTKAAESYGIDPAVFLASGEYKGSSISPAVVETWFNCVIGPIYQNTGDYAPAVANIVQYGGFRLGRQVNMPEGDYWADIYLMNRWPDLTTKKISIQGKLTNYLTAARWTTTDIDSEQWSGFDSMVRVDVWVGGTCVRAMFKQWSSE